ncbi:hypothetical protein ACEPAI_4598 [Sanghuangporus weigelae]
MSSGLLSDVLGWISIGCWLGAQFPQVLENIRRQSCEGLALPFLFNWLLGDFTNLIGCILTHQLPFQTILATYFVSVDFMLFSQYFYYRRPAKKLQVDGSLPSSPIQRYGTRGRRTSTEHEHSHHYRELSTAAANVAIAAALAASASEEQILQDHAKETNWKQRPAHRSSTSITRSEAEEAEDEVDEDALAALADSFHSDGGRKRVSWSQERYGSARGGSASRTRSSGRVNVSPLTPMYTASSAGMPDNSVAIVTGRGRPLERQIQIVDSPIEVNDLEGNAEVVHRSVSQSVVRARRNSRASQRSARLVFLGVWALFGIGTLSQRSQIIPESRGVVLSEVPSPSPLYPAAISNLLPSGSFKEPMFTDFTLEQSTNSGPEEPSSERIIGRIFAWTCTTLYLTSRLPQIWKNFVRKSVEGLSMYLFVFAFLGNTFYVLSILSSPMMSKPRPISTAFLLESMPYLLGSGGTLLFDVTIVSQSLLYRPRHVHGHHHHQHSHTHTHNRHRSSYSRPRTSSYNPVQKHGSMDSVPEEERALLRSPSSPTYVRNRDLERGLGTSDGECGLHVQTRLRKDPSEDDERLAS